MVAGPCSRNEPPTAAGEELLAAKLWAPFRDTACPVMFTVVRNLRQRTLRALRRLLL